MKIGDAVSCSAYIKPTKNCYEIDEKDTICIFHPSRGDEIAIEEDHVCDRFTVRNTKFSGIFVGVTTRCMKLGAVLDQPYYGRDRWRVECSNPIKVAIIYYANNKKRFVPIANITPYDSVGVACGTVTVTT